MLKLQKTLVINGSLALQNLISVYEYLKGGCDRAGGSGHNHTQKALSEEQVAVVCCGGFCVCLFLLGWHRLH